MNPLKTNFSRNNKMKPEFCIEKCGKIIDNEHLTWCESLNSVTDYKFSHLLNGNLKEKLNTLKQIKQNEERRRNKETPPVIQ